MKEDDQARCDDGKEVGDREPAHAPFENEVGRPEGVDNSVGGGDEEEIEEDQDGELLLAGLDLGDPAQDGVGPFGGDAVPPSGQAEARLARKGRRVNVAKGGLTSPRRPGASWPAPARAGQGPRSSIYRGTSGNARWPWPCRPSFRRAPPHGNDKWG